MPSVDLDSPEHEICSRVMAGYKDRIDAAAAERDRLLEIVRNAHEALRVIHDEYESGPAFKLSRDALTKIRRLLPNVDFEPTPCMGVAEKEKV
jgi:hypothetical protein